MISLPRFFEFEVKYPEIDFEEKYDINIMDYYQRSYEENAKIIERTAFNDENYYFIYHLIFLPLATIVIPLFTILISSSSILKIKWKFIEYPNLQSDELPVSFFFDYQRNLD